MQVDAGLDKDMVLGDPKAPRFVFWDKKLRATPSGPDVLTFDLLTLWGKLRAGLGAIGVKSGPPGLPKSDKFCAMCPGHALQIVVVHHCKSWQPCCLRAVLHEDV